MAQDIVRQVMGSEAADVQSMTKKVRADFLARNRITRSDLAAVLAEAIGGMYVLPDVGTKSTIVGDYVMGDKIEIRNKGQIAGTIGGRGGRVRIGQQQQANLDPKSEELLRSHLGAPEVQEALALPVSTEEKAQIAGGRLAKIAKVGADIGVDFMSKFLAEMAKQ